MNPWQDNIRIRRAATIMRRGGIVLYPTEGVWGLGCDPANERAVDRILALKRRKKSMGLILVGASIQQFEPYLTGVTPEQRNQLERSWPGPNTWLIPNNGEAPEWITGGRPSLAVRVSDHPLVVALCSAFNGPIVSTSANPHGLPPAKTSLKARDYFQGQVDDVLPGRVGASARPTAIRSLTTGDVIRA